MRDRRLRRPEEVLSEPIPATMLGAHASTHGVAGSDPVAIANTQVSGLGTMSTQAASAVAISGGSITGLATPTASSDAATKSYVDSVAAGLKAKASVKAATTVPGTLASSFENGDTVDGIVLATGDRLLIKDQAAPAENGIYIVAASGAPARATDADAGSELVSAFVFVEQGTANADKAFVCTNDAITLGVTSIVFVAFASVVGALIAANNLSDVANAATARTNLGLAIGTNVQAFDAELAAIAGLTSAADKVPYFTGSGAAALADLSAFARTLIAAAAAVNARSTLGLVIGTDVQAQDAELAAIAGLTSAADRLPYFTGSGAAALATFTAAGRTLVAAADAAAQRAALGLGGLAVLDSPVQTGRIIQVLKEHATTSLLSLGISAPTETNPGISADANTFASKRYLTLGSSGSTAGLITPVLARIGYNGDYVFGVNVGNTITDYRLWVGLTSTTLGGVSGPTTQHVAALRYDTGVDGTAFWRMVTCDGAGTPTVTASSIAIAASTFYTVRIVTSASSVAFYVNGVLAGSIATTLPTAATNLSMEAVCTALIASSRRFEFSRFGAFTL